MSNEFQSEPALLIIDVQKGFVGSQLVSLAQRIERLQASYNHIGIIRFSNLPESGYRKWIGWNQLTPGTTETSLVFTARPDARHFEKHGYSAFLTPLCEWLETLEIKEVHLCGIRTENCILKTACDFFEYNRWKPCVLAEYCGSPYPELHNAGLEIIKTMIGEEQVLGKS